MNRSLIASGVPDIGGDAVRMRNRFKHSGLVLFVLAIAVPSGAVDQGVAMEGDGSIVVVVTSQSVIVRINPVTGAISVVSSSTVGSGPSLSFPTDVVVEEDGSLVVTNSQNRTVIVVDPVTGDRTLLSGGGAGSGPALGGDASLAVEANGNLVLADTPATGLQTTVILRIDRATGDRSVVSDAPSPGGGPDFNDPYGIAVEPAGTLIVTNPLRNDVLRVQPDTGDRSIVVDSKHPGSGPPMLAPSGVVVAPDENLLIGSFASEYYFCLERFVCVRIAGAVTRVDPHTGDRIRVSGGGVFLEAGVRITPYLGKRGRGPMARHILDVAVESEDSLVATFESSGAIEHGLMRIDAETGNREIIAVFDAPAAGLRDGRFSRVRDAAAQTLSFVEGVRRLKAFDANRVYRLADETTWLRDALGERNAALAARTSLAEMFKGLSPLERRRAAERLFRALRTVMVERLGEADPATRAVTAALAERPFAGTRR